MNKVDKIVNKILNHYSNLNKLEDLQKILKENKKNQLPKVTKKVEQPKVTKKVEKSSLIFSCNNQNDSCDNNSNDNESCDNNDDNTRPQLTNLIEKYFNNSELNSEQEALKNFIDDYKKNANTSLILISDPDKKEFNLYYNYQFTGIVLSVDNKSTLLNKNIYELCLLYFSEHINFLTDKNYLLLDSFTITNEINLDDFMLTKNGVSSPFLRLNLNNKTIEPFNHI
jgi:hypothetical protein